MKIFHERVVRGAATNESVTLAAGVGGHVVAACCSDQTTGSLVIPMYLAPLSAQYLAGVGAVAGSLDPAKTMPLIPANGQVQGGVREWVGWYGRASMKDDTLAVVFDITICPAGDIIECLVGIDD